MGSPDGLDRLAATDWVAYGQELASHMAGLDRDAVARIDALWFGAPAGPDQNTRAEIGRLARFGRGLQIVQGRGRFVDHRPHVGAGIGRIADHQRPR